MTLYYYMFLGLVVFSVVICHRLELSRIGRAWMAIREDEIAAKAMGINTRNMKLLAFGMGATFGGVSGSMFAAFQGFVSPESFSLMESIMIVAMVVLGGIGHLPGVILGAVLLAALPEVLRYVAGPLQQMTDGRLGRRHPAPAADRQRHDRIMLMRPRGLWPTPEHGKAAPAADPDDELRRRRMSDIVLNVQGVSKRFGGLQALSDVGITIERRPGLRPDRPQRRRQDHLLQRADRPVHARRRHLRARRHALQAVGGARGGQGRASRAPSRTSACSPR